jgi:hypothetical protein
VDATADAITVTVKTVSGETVDAFVLRPKRR